MFNSRAFLRGLAAAALLVGVGSRLPLPASAATASLPYDDIASSYARSAIVRLSDRDVVHGKAERQFAPLAPITRAEFVVMIERLLRLAPANAVIPAYADAPKTAWFYAELQAAVQLDIARGTSADRFEPNRQVTRQEAAVLLARALKLTLPANAADTYGYADASRIAVWAAPAVLRLGQLGLMQGDGGAFRPADPITRQEAAVLLDRVLQRPDWLAQIDREPADRIQIGWQYGQTTAQYEKQVASSNVNRLSPRWFFLSKTGVTSNVDASLVAWAHGRGKQVWAMVGNRSDQALTHQILSQSSQRDAAIDALTALAKQYGIDGLNLDFENVAPADRADLTRFVAALADALHSENKVLSVNVSPDLGSDWTEAFDYAAIGRQADYVVLMAYDEHWSGGAAGSVSSLPWLRRGLEKLLAAVPASKTVLALPFYNRDWTIGGAAAAGSTERSLVQQNETVRALGLKPAWDASLGQYTAQYVQAGVRHALWLEDGRSLTRKMQAGQALGIAGYAYWYMGGESADVWNSLRNAARFGAYTFD
ncbi:S-layer homology domain-containing protein [Cohnella nanjingensis]|uniref:S-layer homology domain-containing protein n=1 Tax=Cohnella nanjingensis TaxID=1387779 RepID=A0A7X0RSJ5_9BACL|nr:S-layer homology domain-containing protein [Cohnella nanjingensis]MBB6672718.1 S-layer homology domain-containing protein [Cohnella nanjingensis]